MKTKKTTHTSGPLDSVLFFLDAACDEDENINHNRNIGQAIETLRAALPIHAAAPDLLAALEMAHEALSANRGYAQGTTATKIRAAIRRAVEGK